MHPVYSSGEFLGHMTGAYSINGEFLGYYPYPSWLAGWNQISIPVYSISGECLGHMTRAYSINGEFLGCYPTLPPTGEIQPDCREDEGTKVCVHS